MKAIMAVLGCVLVLLAAAMPCSAAMPKTLVGVALGDDIKNYRDLLREDSTAIAEDYPFLKEVTIPPGKIPGVRLGVIAYGNCANPGTIVRIKLKLSQPDRYFFKELLKAYKKELGDPQKYRGDPFQNLLAWKWSFRKDGQRISLIISNSRDPEESMGNQIKISLQCLISQERECWRKKHRPQPGVKTTTKDDPFNIMDLVPK